MWIVEHSLVSRTTCTVTFRLDELEETVRGLFRLLCSALHSFLDFLTIVASKACVQQMV
jgi:hypothetical protein